MKKTNIACARKFNNIFGANPLPITSHMGERGFSPKVFLYELEKIIGNTPRNSMSNKERSVLQRKVHKIGAPGTPSFDTVVNSGSFKSFQDSFVANLQKIRRTGDFDKVIRKIVGIFIHSLNRVSGDSARTQIIPLDTSSIDLEAFFTDTEVGVLFREVAVLIARKGYSGKDMRVPLSDVAVGRNLPFLVCKSAFIIPLKQLLLVTLAKKVIEKAVFLRPPLSKSTTLKLKDQLLSMVVRDNFSSWDIRKPLGVVAEYIVASLKDNILFDSRLEYLAKNRRFLVYTLPRELLDMGAGYYVLPRVAKPRPITKNDVCQVLKLKNGSRYWVRLSSKAVKALNVLQNCPLKIDGVYLDLLRTVDNESEELLRNGNELPFLSQAQYNKHEAHALACSLQKMNDDLYLEYKATLKLFTRSTDKKGFNTPFFTYDPELSVMVNVQRYMGITNRDVENHKQ